MLGGLVALIVLLALVLVLVRSGDDGDGDDLTTGSSTTTTSEPAPSTSTSTTSSSTSSTTTTTATSSTTTATDPSTTTTTAPVTTAPPPTVAPVRCTGRTGPDDPDPVAQVFYDAWTLDDRSCASRVATDDAIDDLFVFPGEDADWSFEGCMAVDGEDPPMRCYFRYEGGSAALTMGRDPVDGWQVQAVTFTAD